jgi:hypothetical protein
MSELPTIEELQNDEAKLRLAAGAVLMPWPRKHRCLAWHVSPEPKRAITPCSKCGQTPEQEYGCPVPDSATGLLEVIAERLVKKCVNENLSGELMGQWRAMFYPQLTLGSIISFERWIDSTPAERIICCLLALGKAVIA